MFRVTEELVPADLAQWFNNCWGYTKRPKDEEPVLTLFQQMDGESSNAQCYRYKTRDTCEVGRLNLKKLDLYCHWPIGGAINVSIGDSTTAIIMERNIEKQYRRTYSPQWMEVSVPRMWEVMKKHGKIVQTITSSMPQVVWSLFYPSYYTATIALQGIRAGTFVSAAISPHLILIGDATRVYVYDQMKSVGYIDENNRAIITHDNPYVTKRVEKHLNAKLAGGH